MKALSIGAQRNKADGYQLNNRFNARESPKGGFENLKNDNYFHVCRECNNGFFGYIKQDTCFSCIAKWISKNYK